MTPQFQTLPPDQVMDLMERLWLSDETSHGNPCFLPESVPQARFYLEEVLTDVSVQFSHYRILEKFYKARFPLPVPRAAGNGKRSRERTPPPNFRHNTLLPESTALAIAERGVGPEVLPEPDLARLLLNPLALWDVADLIQETFPVSWLPRLDEQGRRFMEKHDLKFEIPGANQIWPESVEEDRELRVLVDSTMDIAHVKNRGHDAWELCFDKSEQSLREELSRKMYGDVRPFTLMLYRVPEVGKKDVARAEVRVAPSPLQNPLKIGIVFPTVSESQEFEVKVPLAVSSGEEPEPDAPSVPSDPLPLTAFSFKDGNWRESKDLPTFELRNVQSGAVE